MVTTTDATPDFTDLQSQVAKLTTEASSSRALGLIEAGRKEGKITPAMNDWAMSYASTNPEGFGGWLAVAPVIIAPGTDPALAGKDPAAQSDGALTATELAVCTNLGITPEAYRASQKKDA